MCCTLRPWVRNGRGADLLWKTDIVDEFKDFEFWATSMKGFVTLVRIVYDIVYMHGAIAMYHHAHGIRVSPSTPHLKEMNGKTERYFGTVMSPTRALLTTSGLPETFRPLAVYHATYSKNRLHYSALGDHLHFCMVFEYNPDLSHLRIFGSQVHSFPPQEREGELYDRTQAGRYVGHTASRTICIWFWYWRENERSFKRGRAEIVECLHEAHIQMNKVPEIYLEDDCFIDYFVFKHEPFFGFDA